MVAGICGNQQLTVTCPAKKTEESDERRQRSQTSAATGGSVYGSREV